MNDFSLHGNMHAAAVELMRRRRLRRECETLAGFVKTFWHILEPGNPLKWGWALDAICEHLEAVSRGDIKRLIINVPPGMSKSLTTSVFWPAWEWSREPWLRILGTAHTTTLSERDSARFAKLVTSDLYRSLFSDKVQLTRTNNRKIENAARGFREAMAFTSLTGSRGNRLIIDDPLSVDQAKSPTELKNVADTFTEAVPSRVNDPEEDAIVMIMQRLHESDPTGLAVEHDLGYELLMLPMEFEPERRCCTSIGFMDPRTQEGELLFPERFTPAVVERDKKAMMSVNGSYAVAAQYQQRPSPRGGGLFQREWFQVIETCPRLIKAVRGWDLAATASADSARTAGVLMGIDTQQRVIIANVVKNQLSPDGVVKMIKSTASLDGQKVKGSLPRDPGQAGKAQIAYLIKQLMGYSYSASPESGDKVTRAQPLAAQAESGNLYLVRGDWNQDYIDELALFPAGKFADQVDASSRAFMVLTESKASMLDIL